MMNKMRPIHSGEILRGKMEEMSRSARGLAAALGVPVNRVTGILDCQRAVKADTALRLARYFGGTPEFWLDNVLYHANVTVLTDWPSHMRVVSFIEPDIAEPDYEPEKGW